MRQSNHHERSKDIDRPSELGDPLSFESMCAVADQSNRLQALMSKNKLLRHSVALAEDADALTEYQPPDDTPTPEDSPQCRGWGPKLGKCLNFAATWMRSDLCNQCHMLRLAQHDGGSSPEYDADGLTFRDRVADGHMTPADAERLQGEAEEQGEER